MEDGEDLAKTTQVEFNEELGTSGKAAGAAGSSFF